MRIALHTGKGGVGKTTISAATAIACAHGGARTLLVSTDPAHSTADVLGVAVLADPTPVPGVPNLWAAQVDTRGRFEQSWSHIRGYLVGVLAARGMAEVQAEELTVLPGAEEIVALLELRRLAESGEFDAIIVDCAPTGETLRLLGFPDIARWWLQKVFPWERRLVGAARPLARKLDLPLPGPEVFDDVQRLVRNLIEMNAILRDRERCSIRLVTNPDRMVIKEAQRTFTYLNLYGFLTDAVIVNRVFPADLDHGYFGRWRERQRANLEMVREGFAPVPVLEARYFDEEVIGPQMLDRLGQELFAGVAPERVLHTELTREISMDGEVPTLRLPIPFAEKEGIDLKMVGDELVVAAGGEKRTIILPAGLSGHRPSGASFEEGTLTVRFEDAAARAQPEPV